jgi:transposase
LKKGGWICWSQGSTTNSRVGRDNGGWCIVDLCCWVAERWDVSYSETGMLRLLWSLDLSHRKTRPHHPQTDEKAQQALKKGALQPA